MEKVIIHVLKRPGIHILDFICRPAPGRNVLDWTVDREIGNSKWLIKRGIGSGKLQLIAEIERNPVDTGIRTYSYVDEKLSDSQSFIYHLFTLMESGEEFFVDSLKTDTFEPEGFSLLRNYPNPFNDRTHLIFGLSKSQPVSLAIYNISGQLVKTLVNRQSLPADYFNLIWDGTDSHGRKVSSGSYYVRLQGDSDEKTIKILLMK